MKTDTETLPTINEEDTNDIRQTRDSNSKQYSGKEYTEKQINEMESNYINILSNRYKSVLSAQMTKSLGNLTLSNLGLSIPPI